MRIAHVIWGLGTGGAETMLADIVNVQVETEKVAIFAVNDLLDESLLHKIDRRCTIKLLRRKVGSKSLIPWIKLNAFLLGFKPDIIHFHLEGMRKMVFHPAPKVFTIHNAYSSNREYPKYQALYAISDGVKNYTKQQGFDAITVWNGIDTKSIRIREKEIKPNSICRMVCVGRLRFVHKGQDVLVKALSILNNEGVINYHLDFIGDGESREELEKMLEEYGLREQVTILGQRDRSYIYDHLCDYNLYVLPSRSEGFGLTVAEAMCAKVPVLVSDLEGPMGVIDGGRLGMSFKSEDPQSLANQIKAFVEQGEDAGQVDEAYQYAVEHFDICRTAKQYIEEYKKVLTRK
jgi:glycosyltransferase involved in cell wall biosynthesis